MLTNSTILIVFVTALLLLYIWISQNEKNSSIFQKEVQEFITKYKNETEIEIDSNSPILKKINDSPETIELIVQWIEENKIKKITFISVIGKDWLQNFCQSIERNTGNIETLIFKNCNFELLEARYISFLIETNQKIRKLDLSNNYISAEGLKVISHSFSKNSTLEDLNLSNIFLLFDDISLISQNLSVNDTIKKLNISKNVMMHEPIGLSNYLKKTNTLTELNMDYCSFHSSTIKEFVNGLKNNNSLISLSISSNPLTEKGCQMIFDSLVDNQKLQVLNLNNTMIQLNGAYIVGEFIMKNSKLTSLSVKDIRALNPHKVSFMNDCLEKNWNLIELFTHDEKSDLQFHTNEIVKRNQQEKKMKRQFHCQNSWNNFKNVKFRFVNKK